MDEDVRRFTLCSRFNVVETMNECCPHVIDYA